MVNWLLAELPGLFVLTVMTKSSGGAASAVRGACAPHPNSSTDRMNTVNKLKTRFMQPLCYPVPLQACATIRCANKKIREFLCPRKSSWIISEMNIMSMETRGAINIAGIKARNRPASAGGKQNGRVHLPRGIVPNPHGICAIRAHERKIAGRFLIGRFRLGVVCQAGAEGGRLLIFDC